MGNALIDAAENMNKEIQYSIGDIVTVQGKKVSVTNYYLYLGKAEDKDNGLCDRFVQLARNILISPTGAINAITVREAVKDIMEYELDEFMFVLYSTSKVVDIALVANEITVECVNSIRKVSSEDIRWQ